MNISKIEMTRPLPLMMEESSDKIYLTHVIWTDTHDEPFGLIATYEEEDIFVFPSQFNKETEEFEPVTDEIGAAIGAYIEANPITLLTEEEIEEVLSHE